MVLSHHRGKANGGGGAQAGDVGQYGRVGQHGALAVVDGSLPGGQELGDVEPLAGGHVPLYLDVARPHRILEDEPLSGVPSRREGRGTEMSRMLLPPREMRKWSRIRPLGRI